MNKKDAIMEVLSEFQVCGLPRLSEDTEKDAYNEMYKRVSKSGSDLSKGSSKSAILGVLERRLRRDASKGCLGQLIKWASEDIDSIRIGKKPKNLNAAKKPWDGRDCNGLTMSKKELNKLSATIKER